VPDGFIQVLPRNEFVEVLTGFEELLSTLSTGDHHNTWAELEAGSWLEVGRILSLLELAECGRIWGKYLIPLPFVETSLLYRWFPQIRPAAGSRSPLTFAVCRTGTDEFIVPHGDRSNLVVSAVSPSGECATYEVQRIESPKMSLDLAPSFPVLWAAGGQRPDGTFVDVERSREYVALLAAEAVGAAESALKATIDYTSVREQFGQPVARFQAVQHKIADMWRDIQLGQTGLIMATPQDKEQAFAAAGVIVDLTRTVCDSAIQLHGGFGYTWDARIHFYLRHVMSVQWIVNNISADG
jgi:Acyl-CoA dehydrogenase, C-terminal domain